MILEIQLSSEESNASVKQMVESSDWETYLWIVVLRMSTAMSGILAGPLNQKCH